MSRLDLACRSTTQHVVCNEVCSRASENKGCGCRSHFCDFLKGWHRWYDVLILLFDYISAFLGKECCWNLAFLARPMFHYGHSFLNQPKQSQTCEYHGANMCVSLSLSRAKVNIRIVGDFIWKACSRPFLASIFSEGVRPNKTTSSHRMFLNRKTKCCFIPIVKGLSAQALFSQLDECIQEDKYECKIMHGFAIYMTHGSSISFFFCVCVSAHWIGMLLNPFWKPEGAEQGAGHAV